MGQEGGLLPSTSRITDTHWTLLSLRPRKKVVISATMGISVCENTTHVTGLSSSCDLLAASRRACQRVSFFTPQPQKRLTRAAIHVSK